MIDPTHKLSVASQAPPLELSLSSVYYRPEPSLGGDLTLMRGLDELHMEHPLAGSRMLRDMLRREGDAVGRREYYGPMDVPMFNRTRPQGVP